MFPLGVSSNTQQDSPGIELSIYLNIPKILCPCIAMFPLGVNSDTQQDSPGIYPYTQWH